MNEKKSRVGLAIFLTFIITTVVVGIFTYTVTVALVNSNKDENLIEEMDSVKGLIDSLYYQEVDDDVLIDGAIHGMVNALDDPYSMYFDKEEWAEFQKEQSGEYSGIGVQVSFDEDIGGVTVNRIFEGTPAEAAGIQIGDVLVGADGESFEGYEYQDIIDAIRGKEGTTVDVDVHRGEETFTVAIVRQSVVADQVYYYMRDDGLGYLELYSFSGNSLEGFNEAKEYFISKGAEGIIIDLRFNPGGDLYIVTQMLDQLLPKGDLIITRDRLGRESSIGSDANMWDIPMVVLVNESSASASELFSIAIQDYERGPIIGTITFGKGVVQSILPLGDGDTAVKLTTSEYFSPLGRSINGIGVTPDYAVEDEDLTDDLDPQMDKAVEVLTEAIQ
ncbi:MAG: S41 family peptidase [Eubacteriales bacterium]